MTTGSRPVVVGYGGPDASVGHGVVVGVDGSEASESVLQRARCSVAVVRP